MLAVRDSPDGATLQHDSAGQTHRKKPRDRGSSKEGRYHQKRPYCRCRGAAGECRSDKVTEIIRPTLKTSKLTRRDKRVGKTKLSNAVELESFTRQHTTLRSCPASVGASRDELEFAIGHVGPGGPSKKTESRPL